MKLLQKNIKTWTRKKTPKYCIKCNKLNKWLKGFYKLIWKGFFLRFKTIYWFILDEKEIAIKTRDYQYYAMVAGLFLFLPLFIGGRQRLWYRFLENIQLMNIMIYLNVRQGFNFDEFLKILNVAQFEFIPNFIRTLASNMGILIVTNDGTGEDLVVSGQEAPTKFSLNDKSSSFV